MLLLQNELTPIIRSSANMTVSVRPATIGLWAALAVHIDVPVAASSHEDESLRAQESVSRPLSPEYEIGRDGSVTLRICFNWSCSRREILRFTSDDMALVKERMATCSGTSLHDRLQRVRIGVWQMELLAEKYQPLLANDLSINEDGRADGRTDCVDNSTNTTTYLSILRDAGGLKGWTVSRPKVRKRFDINAVHWTAVVVDNESGTPWSIDSWFRPNGHLPMVMPLRSWRREKKGWEPPLKRLNPTPRSIHDLCLSPSRAPANAEATAF
jgi:hypothetical protein